MNKVIFQLGVLGFCISAVVVGVNGGSLIEILSRSFLVFVGIVLAVVMLLIVSGAMVENNKRRQQMKERAQAQPSAQAAGQRNQ